MKNLSYITGKGENYKLTTPAGEVIKFQVYTEETDYRNDTPVHCWFASLWSEDLIVFQSLIGEDVNGAETKRELLEFIEELVYNRDIKLYNCETFESKVLA